MTNASLLKTPPRADNDARNLSIVTLPALLGLLCLLGFMLLEVAISKAVLSSSAAQFIYAESGPSGLCSPLSHLGWL